MAEAKKRIKNYTTEVQVETTVHRIEKVLSQYGATKVVKDYDGDGTPCALLFVIRGQNGDVPIKLPCRDKEALKLFQEQHKQGALPKRYAQGEWAGQQAKRVAWRIVEDWVRAQLALWELGMVSLEEVFLAHIYIAEEEMTMFEILQKRSFSLKALPECKI